MFNIVEDESRETVKNPCSMLKKLDDLQSERPDMQQELCKEREIFFIFLEILEEQKMGI